MSRKFEILLPFIILIIVCVPQPISSLDCYDCEYWGGKKGDDSGCQYNPPPKRYLKFCYTSLCYVKYAVEGGKVYTSRQCSHSGLPKGCSNTTFKGNEMGSVVRTGSICVCNDRDGCNTASNSSSPNSYLLIILTFLSFLFCLIAFIS